MKKLLTIIAVTILVWGCAKKMAPASSGGGTSSGSSEVANTPATKPTSAPVTPAVPAAPSAVPVTPATPSGSRTPDADPAKPVAPEVAGQTTYNTKCGKCHGLKVVNDYTADRWISIMQVMAPKAHLTDAEKDNVLAYVKVNAKK
jgi:mono/diheme cytochrome c family protein